MGTKWSRALALLLRKEKLGLLEGLSLKSSKNGSGTALPNAKKTQVVNQKNATNMC
jgi:hypothetical protein